MILKKNIKKTKILKKTMILKNIKKINLCIIKHIFFKLH
jgi:hypothetical protein